MAKSSYNHQKDHKDKDMGVTGNGYGKSNSSQGKNNGKIAEIDEFRPKTSVTRVRIDSQDGKQKKKRPNSVKIIKLLFMFACLKEC